MPSLGAGSRIGMEADLAALTDPRRALLLQNALIARAQMALSGYLIGGASAEDTLRALCDLFDSDQQREAQELAARALAMLDPREVVDFTGYREATLRQSYSVNGKVHP